jgi:putative FmdB family regulatory protein
MGLFDFRCKDCNFTDEYMVNIAVSECKEEPTKCPKCGGTMEKLFSTNGFCFDILGWSPDNEHGKKNWKKRLTTKEQQEVLSPNENGQYRSPW